MKVLTILFGFTVVIIAEPPVQKTCLEDPEPGVCEAYFPMWYYDSESDSCKEFVYGGCGGNGNRYETEQECLNNCRVCGENSHYDPCGTYCPLTCNNYSSAPEPCIQQCNPGCHCSAGNVKNGDDKYIKQEECQI